MYIIMRCEYCGHEIDESKFARNNRQICPECHTVYEAHFPMGVGFISLFLGFLPALYVFTDMNQTFYVALAVFIIAYWAIDIIMNILLIYFGYCEISEYQKDEEF